MSDIPIQSTIRYVTNDAGEKTDVLVPVKVWEEILALIQADSGLEPIDEQEPISQILSDLQTAVQQVQLGQTFPVSQLWDDVDLMS
jgi:hypothetical protein